MKRVVEYEIRWKGFSTISVRRRKLALVVWPIVWATEEARIRFGFLEAAAHAAKESYAEQMDRISSHSLLMGWWEIAHRQDAWAELGRRRTTRRG